MEIVSVIAAAINTPIKLLHCGNTSLPNNDEFLTTILKEDFTSLILQLHLSFTIQTILSVLEFHQDQLSLADFDRRSGIKLLTSVSLSPCPKDKLNCCLISAEHLDEIPTSINL